MLAIKRYTVARVWIWSNPQPIPDSCEDNDDNDVDGINNDDTSVVHGCDGVNAHKMQYKAEQMQ